MGALFHTRGRSTFCNRYPDSDHRFHHVGNRDFQHPTANPLARRRHSRLRSTARLRSCRFFILLFYPSVLFSAFVIPEKTAKRKTGGQGYRLAPFLVSHSVFYSSTAACFLVVRRSRSTAINGERIIGKAPMYTSAHIGYPSYGVTNSFLRFMMSRMVRKIGVIYLMAIFQLTPSLTVEVLFTNSSSLFPFHAHPTITVSRMPMITSP